MLLALRGFFRGVGRSAALRAEGERLGRSGGGRHGKPRPCRTRRSAGLHVLVAPPPGVIRHVRRRRLVQPFFCFSRRRFRLGWPLRNRVPTQLPPPVMNLDRSVFPLAHRHFALGRRVVPALRLHLIKAILMPHHPIVAQGSLCLQPKDLAQLGSRWRR